jgi:hypothetical protein
LVSFWLIPKQYYVSDEAEDIKMLEVGLEVPDSEKPMMEVGYESSEDSVA